MVMSKTYLDSLRLIKGRTSLIKMNQNQYEGSKSDSEHNTSQNQNLIFPDLSGHLSDIETHPYPNKPTINSSIEPGPGGKQKGRQQRSQSPSPTGTPEREEPKPNKIEGKKELPFEKKIVDENAETKNENDWIWSFIFIGSVLLAIVSSYYLGKKISYTFATSGQPKYHTPSKPIICNDFVALSSEFPQQPDKFWAFLKSGVEGVVNKKPTKPSIFMLLHETDVDINLILSKIIEVTQICMGTKERTPIHLTAATLKSPEFLNDYGRVISDYKSALSDSGIMIVKNFSDVPPYVAQAFHTICDGETPYVPRSVIFLTMPVKRISPQDNAYRIAEQELTTLWGSTLKDNILRPLLYRVTDVTLHVNREM